MNKIIYKNKKYFETGKITPAIRRKRPYIPKCDTVYLRIVDPKNTSELYWMTIDEMGGLIMLMSETLWYTIDHPKRGRF